ncbi:hypothetical protein ACQV2R_08200 [Facklamia sp. P12937]|uniref:hypothetical protein n=1 Tax=Facklamia sp. P12937 TaxID=3421949 RepID=UPI003D16A38C
MVAWSPFLFFLTHILLVIDELKLNYTKHAIKKLALRKVLRIRGKLGLKRTKFWRSHVAIALTKALWEQMLPTTLIVALV